MIVWLIFAVLTAAIVGAILYPLVRSGDENISRSSFDATVYKDQLREVDVDMERGLLTADDAEAAKIEISRRLLASADREDVEKGLATGQSRPLVAVILCVVCVPALSLLLYFSHGSPGFPDQPQSARLKQPIEEQGVRALIARVEARLRETPDDGQGWDVIAPVYLKFGRYADARKAFETTIGLNGETKERLFGLGEAIRLDEDGVITAEARTAFQKANALDKDYVPVLYRLAVALEQDGKMNEAVSAWKDIVNRLPEGGDWRKDAERRLAFVEARRSGKPVPPVDPGEEAPGGPTEEQIAAAKEMKPEQRMAMINQMVDGLAERLKENGDDFEGWLKLVRAYSVLGKRDEARQALAQAREKFAGNAPALKLLRDLAVSAGLQEEK